LIFLTIYDNGETLTICGHCTKFVKEAKPEQVLKVAELFASDTGGPNIDPSIKQLSSLWDESMATHQFGRRGCMDKGDQKGPSTLESSLCINIACFEPKLNS